MKKELKYKNSGYSGHKKKRKSNNEKKKYTNTSDSTVGEYSETWIYFYALQTSTKES